MASCASIHGSPIGSFKHDLRERDVYKNEDVDPSRSHLNYSISGRDYTCQECMDKFDALMEGVYHRGGSTVRSAEWSLQAPDDLEPGREKEFFEATYEFVNQYTFGGDDSRVLLDQVHRDEAGQEHLHYVFTFPEITNDKYVDMKEKFVEGAHQAKVHFDIQFTRAQVKDCFTAIQKYESRTDAAREKDAIREIGEALDLKRDDARWCFTRMRRTESERYEKKLMSKDSFLTQKYFDGFHPAWQEWLKEKGFNCTVYKGGGGISLTPEQLKEYTKLTGEKLETRLTIESLANLVNENKVLWQENTKLHERVSELEKQITNTQDRGWGNQSGWGKEKTEDITWNR